MRWLPWLLFTACSSSSPTPVHPAPAPSVQTAAPPAQAPPDERECDALITHAVKLGIDERADAGPNAANAPTLPPGRPRATQADHEAVRRAVHDEFIADCQHLPRAAYRCAMASTTLAALAECQPTQPSLSSSTSNSSVAPPGIAPPAPRAP